MFPRFSPHRLLRRSGQDFKAACDSFPSSASSRFRMASISRSCVITISSSSSRCLSSSGSGPDTDSLPVSARARDSALPIIRPSNIAAQSWFRAGRPKMRYRPTLSISIQDALSADLLSPRPTCCRYFARESVGRASCTNSTSGQSKPSEKISTLTSTFTFPRLKSSTSSRRSEAGVLLSIATASSPCAL